MLPLSPEGDLQRRKASAPRLRDEARWFLFRVSSGTPCGLERQLPCPTVLSAQLSSRTAQISRSAMVAVDLADDDGTVIFTGRQPAQPFAECVECGRISGPYWIRWRACRVDEPDTNEEPEIALYCPACAEREFGPSRRRSLGERRRRPR
jgi:hypothetical protein